MTKRAIIYVPGLGDHNLAGQRLALTLWRRPGLRVEVCPMNWNDKQPLEPKLRKVVNRIDWLATHGYAVSLVGVSAGANAAVHAFARRSDKVAKLVIICGAIQHPEEVGEDTKHENPAFWESMLALHAGVLDKLTDSERRKIVSFIPRSDDVVNPKNMRIEGCHIESLPTHGHVQSIAYAITVATRRVIKNTY